MHDEATLQTDGKNEWFV